MLNTSTDYIDRTVDLEVLQTAAVPEASMQLTQSVSAGGVSRRITGMQKLAQRYALLFLTRLGTVRFSELQGTQFIEAANNGLIQTRNALIGQFVAADSSVRRQLDAELIGDEPADEILASSSLDSYNIDPGTARLVLKINLVSAAGESYTFVIPAP